MSAEFVARISVDDGVRMNLARGACWRSTHNDLDRAPVSARGHRSIRLLQMANCERRASAPMEAICIVI
jgi:hypothetical protein